MSLQVDIQSASTEPVPEEDDLLGWIGAALASQTPDRNETEICLRLVDTEEMATLNRAYRGKEGPTNVLSFPYDLPPEAGLALLGDIVICAPVVRQEALAQHKTLHAHWAHMVVHGTLHLLGYDHVEEHEAAIMEALESDIMLKLDYPCPYDGELPGRERTAP